MADRSGPDPEYAPTDRSAVWNDPGFIRFADPNDDRDDPDWYRPAIVRGPTRWLDVAAIRSGNDEKVWIPGKPAEYRFELESEE